MFSYNTKTNLFLNHHGQVHLFHLGQLEPRDKHSSLLKSEKTGLKLEWLVYDNEITSLIDIYFLQISFIPSDPLRYFIYVTYSTDK
jgi:hypothetical protein